MGDYCSRVGESGGDLGGGVGKKWPDLLTQAKPSICVPLSWVFSTVNQVVALEKSISRAEDKPSDKERNWERPPSSKQ